jgi:hypothetical protein
MVHQITKQILLKVSLGFVVLFSLLIIPLGLNLSYPTVYADDGLEEICRSPEFKDAQICADRAADPNGARVSSLVTNILSFIVYLTASISVLMLVFGSFKYVLSQGESNQTKSAKDTILYALIGLFISVNAMLVVRYVISRI